MPVDRDNTKAAASTIEIGAGLLADGRLLGIYPEGTRSPDGRLHKFRTGVARLALRTGAPVDPGRPDRYRPGAAAGRVSAGTGPRSRCTSGQPLDFSGRPEHERSARVLREVTETVREAVQKLSGQDYVDSYGSSVKAGELKAAERRPS